MWASEVFDEWIKKEIEKLKEEGISSIGTAGVTKLLLNRIIIPNNISMVDLIKPYIKIKRGKKQIVE